jgi:hypothetical protein
MPEDIGHEMLIADLQAILANAQNFQYHDFKNTLYATPKAVLRARLLDIAQAVVDGKYDN